MPDTIDAPVPVSAARGKKAERWLFLLFVALNAWPVLQHRFFLTQDGPSHLYNAALLRELLFGSDPAIHHVFALNPHPVPNFLSHVLLGLFETVFPLWLAEKLLLLIFLIGLPYAFRAFLRSAKVESPYAAWLIFPATYSFFLYLGFYNFLLALLPFFLFQRVWIKAGKISLRVTLRLSGLLLLLYFSHIYLFCLALLIAGLHAVVNNFIHRGGFQQLAKRTAYLLAVALPFLVLSVFFLLKAPLYDLHLGQNFGKLARALFEMSSLKGVPDVTTNYTRFIAVITGLLAFCACVIRVLRVRKKEEAWIQAPDGWLIAAVILLVLYFTVPDYLGGGMNCVRLQFMLFICTITWLALQKLPRFFLSGGITAILFMHLMLVKIYSSTGSRDAEIGEWIAAGPHIEKGTITLPVVFRENDSWMHSPGYLGASAGIALYDNYEAGLRWFPVVWNDNYEIRMYGLEKHNPLVDDRNQAIVWDKKPVLYADNVIVWDRPRTIADSVLFAPVDSVLKKHYNLDYSSVNLHLYKRKK